tara:strand:- start:883 stop:1917 length:1035 start_codon:yes stop_codon:yes gene_type:complete
MSGGMQGGGGVPDDLLTTKGDTHGFDTDNQRVPIGANTTVLTADSTTALGLAWQAPAAGGADPTITNTWTANQIYNDNVKLLLGTGSDSSLYYDGTDLIINPKEVGSGVIKPSGDIDVVNNKLQFSTDSLGFELYKNGNNELKVTARVADRAQYMTLSSTGTNSSAYTVYRSGDDVTNYSNFSVGAWNVGSGACSINSIGFGTTATPKFNIYMGAGYTKVVEFPALSTSMQMGEAFFSLGNGTPKTLDTNGDAPIVNSYTPIDTFAGAATDNFDGGSNALVTGTLLVFASVADSRDVTAIDGGTATGFNMNLAGNFTMDTTKDKLMVIGRATGEASEVSRSNNS